MTVDRELAKLAKVSTRTLRYYDEIDLLKPAYANEAGYRFYGKKEINLLQQILFYRERGFELKVIRDILYQDKFNIIQALEEHLLELEAQKRHMESLIHTVRQTIQSVKGECEMSDAEKFAGFKEEMVAKNERQYGKEIREKYGEEAVDASNQKLRNFTEQDWQRFQELEETILCRLKEYVSGGISPFGEEGKETTLLHKEWLCMTWKSYTKEAHKGVAAMYVCDERFRSYYDRETGGCAEWLKQAVWHWAEQIEL